MNFKCYTAFALSYFMRRLAERPQNLNLMFKELLKPDILKKVGTIAGIFAGVVATGSILYRVLKK